MDRLIKLASPGEFRPREILRQVIRASLEVAEEELPVGGTFPSNRFARTLDRVARKSIQPCETPSGSKTRPAPEAEISLRAFYAQSPPTADSDVEEIARYLGDQLTANVDDGAEASDVSRLYSPDRVQSSSAA